MSDVRHVQVQWIDGKEFETTTESGHRIVTDARIQAGGNNHGASPMELLLASLGSCTGISFVDILRKKRQSITAIEIRVEGIVGGETYPKVYTDLEVVYVVHGKDISPTAVEDAIHLSKTKYCGISAMLSKTANVKTRYEIILA
jgi:putative redox protein